MLNERNNSQSKLAKVALEMHFAAAVRAACHCHIVDPPAASHNSQFYYNCYVRWHCLCFPYGDIYVASARESNTKASKMVHFTCANEGFPQCNRCVCVCGSEGTSCTNANWLRTKSQTRISITATCTAIYTSRPIPRPILAASNARSLIARACNAAAMCLCTAKSRKLLPPNCNFTF